MKEAPKKQPVKLFFRKETIFTVLMVAITVYALQQSTTFPLGAGLYPLVISIICLGLAMGQVVVELRAKKLEQEAMDISVEESQKGKLAMQRAKRFFLWFMGLYAGIWLVGLKYTMIIFFLSFMWFEGHLKWWRILLLSAIAYVLIFWLLTDVLGMDWQRGLLQELMGQG